MTGELTPKALMTKATRACASARILFEEGDVDGACNRAYYAMFDAARAALLVSGLTLEACRTHSGLISSFSLHLVKQGTVSKELGRTLNRAEEIRLIADYNGDSVETEEAMEMVSQAEAFISAMHAQFMHGILDR